MIDLVKAAHQPDLIMKGYAFTRDGQNIRVFNLNAPDGATVFNQTGEMIETSMDDVAIGIARDDDQPFCFPCFLRNS